MIALTNNLKAFRTPHSLTIYLAANTRMTFILRMVFFSFSQIGKVPYSHLLISSLSPSPSLSLSPPPPSLFLLITSANWAKTKCISLWIYIYIYTGKKKENRPNVVCGYPVFIFFFVLSCFLKTVSALFYNQINANTILKMNNLFSLNLALLYYRDFYI